jgi:hypothetical protein
LAVWVAEVASQRVVGWGSGVSGRDGEVEGWMGARRRWRADDTKRARRTRRRMG